jgi:glycosyltransferase involved in cell wall biosynthesis
MAVNRVSENDRQGAVTSFAVVNGDRAASERTTHLAVSVVVPTKNEAGNVEPLVDALNRVLPERALEIIFVDDSTDDTPDVVRDAADRSARKVTLIHRPEDERVGGLSGAVVAGIEQAAAPLVCVMDGDLQHPPELVAELVDVAERDDADLVIASRFVGARRVKAFGLLRAAISQAFSLMARVLFPHALRNVTDPMSGFFVVRREAVDLARLRPRGFKILLELLVRMPTPRVREVPFTFGKRHAGESKASIREGLRYLRLLLDLRLGERGYRFLRFSLVGASGLAVNVLAFAVFAHVAGFHYLLAAVLSTQVSTAWNFVWLEAWALRGHESKRRGGTRAAMFFLTNNAALLLRGPMLVVLVDGLGLDDVLANFITLAALTVARFAVSDRWIWGAKQAAPPLYLYSIHDLVTVESPVGLRELERFRVEALRGRPTIRVRLGKLSSAQSELVTSLAFLTRHIRYDEGLGRFGFGVEIAIGKSIEIVASPMLRHSPHVLYTNIVEPVLRWTFAKKGWALAHGACVAVGDEAYLITARTDTGKTTTVLKMLRDKRFAFLSDDLTLISRDGRVLTYPKPLTISSHTVHAIEAPLGRRERLALLFQSRVHSRSGRRFAFLLASTHLPVATINAIVQWLIPPPKYHVDRLVEGVSLAREARLTRFAVIERGGQGEMLLPPSEAVQTLVENTEDAFGFPPYPFIEHFLHSGNGRDLREVEREIIAEALAEIPAFRVQSESMDWSTRIPVMFGHARPALEAPLDAVPNLVPAG